MKFKIFKVASLFLIITALFYACGTSKNQSGSKGLNLFTVQQDKDLGAKVAHEIDSNSREYPLLDSIKYREVYTYIYKVRDNILNSGKVTHKDDFKWRLRIIHDDSTLNAFCTPGGYIYIYTGILKFMDSEDQLAGVMGHEIGHADMRHSTRQMTTMFGVQVIQQILLGDKALLNQLTSAIVGLKFSRKHETEADERSVMYLCPTQYNAAGGAGFFQKIEAAGSGKRPPEFLSTHPNPDGRIEHFLNSQVTLGCSGKQTYAAEYKKMVSLLPK
jgi:predicted Zn-dependent protease